MSWWRRVRYDGLRGEMEGNIHTGLNIRPEGGNLVIVIDR